MDRKRILVVDDEPSVTKVIVAFLDKVGSYEIRAVHRGREAVEIAREWRPDLVVLDIMMPDLDGGETLAEIRAQEGCGDTRAIFLTGLVTEAEVGSGGYEVGGQPVLAKPVRAETFREAVAQRLSAG